MCTMKSLAVGIGLALCFATLTDAVAQEKCDPVKSSAIKDVFIKQLAGLSCDGLKYETKFGNIAIDKEAHTVPHACYVVAPNEDRVSVHAQVSCRSSEEAFFFPNRGPQEDLHARIRIGKDCTLVDSDLEAGGEIGKVIVNTVEFFKGFRPPLQQAVTQVCKIR